jgi:hypothetical protein
MQQNQADRSYWWVPLDARPPKQVAELAGIDISSRTIQLHPDRRRLAMGVRTLADSGDQVWVLENFLPAVKR